LYWLLKVLLAPFLRLGWRPWVQGLENLPQDGPVILASNHLSFLDSFFLPLVVPRRVTFLAKIDYFTEPGVKGWFKKMFFSGAGQVPIDRAGGHASQAALNTGVRLLREGHVLGIYPEGTRSPDGKLYRGRVGVARMALEAGVPVIPVAMIGTFEVQPAGKAIPRPGRVGIRIGKPMDFSRYQEAVSDRFALRSITDEIMYELMRLSDQEYVDIYATKRKDQLAAARRSVVAATGRMVRSHGEHHHRHADDASGPQDSGHTSPAVTRRPRLARVMSGAVARIGVQERRAS
jgi:1-acyl-sn-glycerol-3-phosphate acyltransferase